MCRRLVHSVCFFALLGAFTACSDQQPETSEPVAEIAETSDVTTGSIDGARIVDADATPGEWLSHGRTYSEQRFSPLTLINQNNVADLGLAWYADLPTRRGIETTPLMADGKLYVTGSWGHVLAYDARTGEPLWHFDPKVPKDYGRHACCDVVNRGVALWAKNVYAASLDGRLRALDRDTGDVVWEVDTRLNHSVRCLDRRANLALLHGTRQSRGRLRGRDTEMDRDHLDG